MTTFALSRSSSGTGWLSALGIPALFSRISRRLTIRSDRKALQSMPDYILADLGISRGEIDRAIEYGRSALAADRR